MQSPSVRRRFGDLPRPRIGATARRITVAILLTALIPAVSTLILARTIIRRITETAFQPEFGQHLDQALGVYADLARALKGGMRSEAEAIAASDALRAAASSREAAKMNQALDAELEQHPALASAVLESCAGERLAMRERGPVDRAKERAFTVRHVLAQGVDPGCEDDKSAMLVATFTTPAARFQEVESAQAFAQAYHQLERHHREEYLNQTYLNVFLVVIAMTLALGAAAGVLVTRPVTRRIARLAEATGPVAGGDLSVRVDLGGRDEVTALGTAFNHMLEELERSRERIDFLRRMGEWQKMARRLAHEIKNPLTPIQLAVEECHRRYSGEDAAYKRILQTTLEVVEEEIGTLRRLVGEFSSFARLPRAELMPADLAEFLREQRDHFVTTGERVSFSPTAAEDAELWGAVDVAFDVPDAEMPAEIDREMLHRVLRNLVKNAAQALRDARPRDAPAPWGHVRVALERGVDAYVLTVDDDGPGIPADVRASIFDPYVTTKRDGTGLGLSIVKKVIVDHGGSIDALDGPLGGARFKIILPRPGTPDARAAAWRSHAPTDGSGAPSSR